MASFTSEVYIAFQFQTQTTGETDPYDKHPGWLHTGHDYDDDDVHTSSSYTNAQASLPEQPKETTNNNFPYAPGTKLAYSRARSCDMHLKQEYAGINSSGGPQVACRAEHSDVIVVRDCDLISPHLFQYCCSGWQIPSVYIIRYIGAEDLTYNFCHEWVLTGVQVTNYKFTHGLSYNDFTDGVTLSCRETVSLLYTAVKYRCSRFEGSATLTLANGDYKGWDTGKNTLPT